MGGVERGKRRVSWPCTSWNAHDARLVLLALSCSPCAARLACYSLRRGTARTDAVTGVVTKNGAPAPGESRERQATAVFPLPSRWSHPGVAETRLSCIDSRALGPSSPLLRNRNTLPAHHPANSSSIPPRTALLHPGAHVHTASQSPAPATSSGIAYRRFPPACARRSRSSSSPAPSRAATSSPPPTGTPPTHTDGTVRRPVRAASTCCSASPSGRSSSSTMWGGDAPGMAPAADARMALALRQ